MMAAVTISPESAAADAFFAAVRALADVQPGGRWESAENGTALLISDSQMSSLNGVFAQRLEADAAEMDRLAGPAAETGLPWSIGVRGEPGADVLEVAARHGRTGRHQTPMLVCPSGDALFRGQTGPATVRTITSAERKVVGETLAAGFRAPVGMVLSLMTEQVIDAPWAETYLVEVDGTPVATGMGILNGDHIGVYNIATAPEFQGRGYGRLVTERVMTDGFAAGATTSYLQSSKAGRPLYETMGFRTVETWTYLT
jgi:ribosomal protein S18 acetylase RimI-like enzyme